MDFRDAKELCKHAAPATKCPATFQDCNADNCPLVRKEFKRRCKIILNKYTTKIAAYLEDMESELKQEYEN